MNRIWIGYEMDMNKIWRECRNEKKIIERIENEE
jgi:hypothetical protein